MTRPALHIARSLVLCAALLGSPGVKAQNPTLTVTTPVANLHNGPAADQRVVGSVRQGDRVVIEQVGPKYALVRSATGLRAWLNWPAQGWTQTELGTSASGGTPSAPTPQATPIPGVTTLSMSLADIGYRDGHHFEGGHATHSQSFYFPVPHDGQRSGTLRLHLRLSDHLDPLSTLRVDLGDRPVRQISLTDRKLGEWLDIPVSGADFTRDRLKVTLRVQMLASRDRCFDERALALHFFQLLPDSRFDLVASGAEDNLRSVWATLPNPVRIFAGSLTSATGLATTLELGLHLHRMNRQIRWAETADGADILIDGDTTLARRHTAFRQGTDKDGGIALMKRTGQRPQILVSDRVSPSLFASLQPGWVNLLKGATYVRLGDSDPGQVAPQGLELSRLGLTGAKSVHRNAEWTIDLAAPQIPAHLKPASLKLNYIGTPDPEQSRFMLYLYLNGQLQEVRALQITGRPQSANLALGAAALRTGNNSIRVVVQRLGKEGNCSAELDGVPFEILPGSSVALTTDNDVPRRFSDLRAAFSRGMEVAIDRSLLADPARLMPFLIGVIGNHEYPIDHTQVRIIDDATGFKPARPFLLASTTSLAPAEASVRFDKGAVRVVDDQKRTLLAVSDLPGLTIAQIVSHNGQKGLWLIPAQGAPLPVGKKLFLDQDDIAFADAEGSLLTLDSRSPNVSSIDYPEYTTWLDFIERHRFWLIAFGWTLIVVLMVQLYRKTKAHRSVK